MARANALLGAAEGLLGQVLRDPGPVRGVLREAEATGDRAVRRAAALALGLLGALADEAHALAANGDSFDVSASILAVVLNDPVAAPDRIARIGVTAQNAETARITQNAAMRVQRGRLISVIG